MSAKSLALILGVSLSGLPASAADNDFWAAVGNWDVSVDPTIGNGCYALASWNGGTVLRIGRNPQKDNFYFLVGNDDWRSISPDGSYDIQVQFGSRPVWDVSASGLQFNSGETVYLHAQSTKMDFIAEFQAALNMRISYNGKEIDNLKLNGSRRAWDEVEKCQREMNSRGSTGKDPFAETDPFADSNGQTKDKAVKNRVRKN